MKLKTPLFLILFMTCQWASCQLYHIHWDNHDSRTRAKLALQIASLSKRNTAIGATNKMLATALYNHRMQLMQNYTRNYFDRKNSFLASSAGSASLSLGTSVLSQYPSLPYMTGTKRDYLEQLAMDKALLLAIQYVDASKIKSSNRQQIYRLRGELIRQFSKNDREARKLLMLSVGAMGLMNADQFLELKQLLDSIEIVL